MMKENSNMLFDEEDGTTIDSLQTRKGGKNIFFHLFEGISLVFKPDELGWEIAVIALPVLLALMADPLASLVDTAFIGRLGSVELAAVGVSIAVFNLVSKLLNFPILNITVSFVAEEEATESKHVEILELQLDSVHHPMNGDKDGFLAVEDNESAEENCLNNKELDNETHDTTEVEGVKQKNLPAVFTALIVGSGLGLLELAILVVGSGPILDIMGVPMTSKMRTPAEQYLALRAIGAPAVVVSLAVQGVFRGFKDTRTPFYATVSGNIVNMVLVPILMFFLGFGVGGAAVATVISQYFIALFLLLKLRKRVVFFPPKLADLQLGRFLKNGFLLLARSTAVMLSLTLATSEAARQGAIPMAAHQICMQVWLATSLLSDSVALAGQAIIASAFAKGNHALVKDAAFRTLQIGFMFGVILAIILGVGLSTFCRLFTNDPHVVEFLALGIPFVAATQPVNSLAFVFDGLHFGASDFAYAAKSMIIVSFLASVFMIVASPMWGFIGVWVGLTILMTMRMLAGLLRICTASGPWKFLK